MPEQQTVSERVYDRELMLKRIKQPKAKLFVWTVFNKYVRITRSEAAAVIRDAKDAGRKIRLDIPAPTFFRGVQLTATLIFLSPYTE